MGIGTEQAIAVGDGANDLPMMARGRPVDRLPPQAGGAGAGHAVDHRAAAWTARWSCCRPDARPAARGPDRALGQTSLTTTGADLLRCSSFPHPEIPMPQTKFLLDESRMPRHWYNIMADLPVPPAPPLHPGTLQPVGPDDLAPLFPMELILQEVSTEREVADPRAGARRLPPLAAEPAGARPPPGEGPGHAGQDLLQVRRRVARRIAQAQYRRAAGLVQRPGRGEEDRHRNRRRAMGLVAGLRRRAVRASRSPSSRCASPTTRSPTGAR